MENEETDKNETFLTPGGKEIDFYQKAPPGYALTQPKGKFPWDSPPKYTNPDDAYDYIVEKLYNSQTIIQTIELLEMDVNPIIIAKSILNMGWSRGLWTPDVAEVLVPAIVTDITIIASEADVDINFGEDNIPIHKDVVKEYEEANKIDEEEVEEIQETLKDRADKAIKNISYGDVGGSSLMSKKGE